MAANQPADPLRTEIAPHWSVRRITLCLSVKNAVRLAAIPGHYPGRAWRNCPQGLFTAQTM